MEKYTYFIFPEVEVLIDSYFKENVESIKVFYFSTSVLLFIKFFLISSATEEEILLVFQGIVSPYGSQTITFPHLLWKLASCLYLIW